MPCGVVILIKNLIGKKEPKQEPVKDEELQKLRDKFNNIVKSDSTVSEGEHKPQQPSAQPAAGPAKVQPGPQGAADNYQYVDPQRAEDNERITNLIMQQIKELIEIDNNLNAKNKELETKISDNASSLTQTKSIVEQFNSRLELIEKNMEKFMGLYEVVTNRFNPFVSPDAGSENNPGEENVSLSGTSSSHPQKGSAVVEDALAEGPKDVEKEAGDIIVGSGVREKLVTEQQDIIKDEIAQALEKAGPSVETPEAKKELSSQLSLVVSEELKKSMEHHIRLSNEDLKKAIREMLIEVVGHIRKISSQAQPGPAKPAQPAQSAQPVETGNSQAEGEEDEVHPDYHFYLSDGTAIKSVAGLKRALEKMDDSTFSEHVTGDRNDFADWIRVVLNNDQVADRMAKEKTKGGIRTVLDALK